MTKKSIRPNLIKGQVFDMIDWDDPKMHLPSIKHCMVCFTNLQSMISDNALEFTTLPIEFRIALLTDIIQKKKLLKCIFSQNDNEFFELKLAFEIENLKQQKHYALEKQQPLSVTDLLALFGLKKIHARGTMREIGIKWGEFIFHTKNSKGELMFDTEAVDVAKLIEVIVEPPVGKECILHTIEGYVGEGRNS